ncbi:unnamed protein product [Rhizoctonia solani]|uniref:C2H2-type domain-containing protein n=1 Tax=Rhizoctonia solani TaxID=456999 RepID=A0A8H3C0B9_9AGAM|nr:unnamed protein product [Rhizoctonia solani]
MSPYYILTYTILLFLALYIYMTSIVGESINYAHAESVNDSNDSNDHDHDEIQVNVIEDWSEYGDEEVWEAVRKMLEILPQESNQQIETTGLKSDSHAPPAKPGEILLNKAYADILLKGRGYFIHFPSIYCFDENRIIFRIIEGPTYCNVTAIDPNPPAVGAPFEIGGIRYAFDESRVLWFEMAGIWLPEIVYAELNVALTEVIAYIEKYNLHISADPIYNPLNGDPDQGTSSGSGTHDADMDIPEEGPQALSPNPDQEEVDNWMEDLKRQRAMQVKEGIRVATIRCPVTTCGKVQRRPQALRDHLYFHFNIKPHRCDYGCPIAFETEANKNRHHETCPVLWRPPSH